MKCLWGNLVKISGRQLDTWVWSSGEGLEVVPEVTRLDEVIWEGLVLGMGLREEVKDYKFRQVVEEV